MINQRPSPELLRKLLRYEPETGKLFWRERTPDMFTDGKYSAENICGAWNGRLAGKEAFGSTNVSGYRCSQIFGSDCRSSRVIWAIVTGAWPEGQIDHINGVRSDDRDVNLREVSTQENSRNQKLRATNTSGTMGVWRDKRARKWRASIRVKGRALHLGYYQKETDAIAARKAAEVDNGFHPNHGRES